MELAAWGMTKLWLGDYYRTYAQTVEDEVRRALASAADFKSGGPLPMRDRAMRQVGFVVRDHNYLSAAGPATATVWRRNCCSCWLSARRLSACRAEAPHPPSICTLLCCTVPIDDGKLPD